MKIFGAYDFVCIYVSSVLNLRKSKKAFSKRNSLTTEHLIGSQKLDHIDLFMNFGELLIIELGLTKARSVLILVKLLSKDFNDPYIRKTLYMGLVRQILL